jgi:hypothetical protein
MDVARLQSPADQVDQVDDLGNDLNTMSVPEAGRYCFGGLSAKSAYQAARRGEIPVIRLGDLLKVPQLAVREMYLELGRLAAQRADKRNTEQADAA